MHLNYSFIKKKSDRIRVVLKWRKIDMINFKKKFKKTQTSMILDSDENSIHHIPIKLYTI